MQNLFQREGRMISLKTKMVNKHFMLVSFEVVTLASEQVRIWGIVMTAKRLGTGTPDHSHYLQHTTGLTRNMQARIVRG
jgi:hypothetical protein